MKDPGSPGPFPQAATGRRPARSSAPLGVLLLALALIAARIGAPAFATLATVVGALAAIELATALRRQGAGVRPPAAGLGAAAFPVAAYLWQENGIIAAAAIVVVVSAGLRAIRGLRPDSVRTLAALLLPSIYAGLGCAFFVVVRQTRDGVALAEVLLGLIVAYRLGFWAGSRQAIDGGGPNMISVGGGAVACIVAAVPLGLTLHPRPELTAMLGIGLFVGLAATIGVLASAMLTGKPREGTKPAPRPVLSQIEPALLAAPAFFYAFRLLFT